MCATEVADAQLGPALSFGRAYAEPATSDNQHSNPADHRYRGLDCTAFGAWTHSARNATGAITHPLKGNSVFSEREALLKCTERFGPDLVSATRIDAKDLTQ